MRLRRQSGARDLLHLFAKTIQLAERGVDVGRDANALKLLVEADGTARTSLANGRPAAPASAKLAGFAGEGALYFGDHFFVAAGEGGLLLVYVTEIELHGGSQTFQIAA